MSFLKPETWSLNLLPAPLIIAELHGARATVKTLFSELGFADALHVLAGVATDQARGEPWRELPTPEDRREKLSRRQIGSAVLLERNLRKVTDDDSARNITRDIVLDASVEFLKMNVPAFRKKRILNMNDAARRRYVGKIQDKFFNADANMEINGDEGLNMTVTRCRFVELLDAIGEREMATLFCEGDSIFFDEHQPAVNLDRPETISAGGDCCDFRFGWK